MANRLPKSVRRVTINGSSGAVAVYERSRKSKKRSRWLKPGEGIFKRVAKALEEGGSSYRRSHAKSNRKRKDGWLKDYPKNTLEAQRKSVKKLIRIF